MNDSKLNGIPPCTNESMPFKRKNILDVTQKTEKKYKISIPSSPRPLISPQVRNTFSIVSGVSLIAALIITLILLFVVNLPFTSALVLVALSTTLLSALALSIILCLACINCVKKPPSIINLVEQNNTSQELSLEKFTKSEKARNRMNFVEKKEQEEEENWSRETLRYLKKAKMAYALLIEKAGQSSDGDIKSDLVMCIQNTITYCIKHLEKKEKENSNENLLADKYRRNIKKLNSLHDQINDNYTNLEEVMQVLTSITTRSMMSL